jgi:hypothetical protein
LVAVLAAVAFKILLITLDFVRQKWLSRNEFDIAGFWIGQCLLPNSKSPYLEIWRYRRKGDRVTLIFYSYHPSSEDISKWVGGGTWRGKMLSAFYYRLAKRTYESGVIAMQLSALHLVGVYAQFDPSHPGEPLYVSTSDNQDYVQTQLLNLSLWSRLKMQFGRPPLRNYEQVKSLYGKTCALQSNTQGPGLNALDVGTKQP